MIKYLIAILLTTSAAYSQTIKTLGYNTTNGQIAYSGSNNLTFTNPLVLSGTADITSPNARSISVGAYKLISGTNTNAISLTYNGNNYYSRFSFNSTTLVDFEPQRTLFSVPLSFSTTTNAATTRTNLGLGTLATNNSVPSGAAASNSILTADGAGSSSFVASKTVTVVKSSDLSRTNTSDLTITNNNDPELTQTVTAGDIYYIGVRLEITTGTNSGFNAGIFTGTNNVFSSTSQTIGTAMRHNLNSTTFYVSTGNPVAQITFGGTGVTAAATRNTWTANGVFRCATNGTLTVRWAQNVASNSATTLHAGSSFTLTKLN